MLNKGGEHDEGEKVRKMEDSTAYARWFSVRGLVPVSRTTELGPHSKVSSQDPSC